MRRVSLVVVVGLLVGCSGPPAKERQQADEAIAAARAAGAATYAPDDLRAAEASIAAYDAAVGQHDYREALSRALDARDRGYEAAKLAADQKKTTVARRDALLADITGLVATAQAHLAAAPAGRGGDRLRRSIRAAGLAMQEARTLSERGNVIGAATPLAGVADGLRKELAAFDAAGKKTKRTPAFS
jgi:hypothetical protein